LEFQLPLWGRHFFLQRHPYCRVYGVQPRLQQPFGLNCYGGQYWLPVFAGLVLEQFAHAMR
jgi:hypothetical protein